MCQKTDENSLSRCMYTSGLNMTSARDSCQNEFTQVVFVTAAKLIHKVNAKLHKIIKEVKSSKLEHLNSKINFVTSEKQVVTIPEDLVICVKKKSVLSGGIKYVPTLLHCEEMITKAMLTSSSGK